MEKAPVKLNQWLLVIVKKFGPGSLSRKTPWAIGDILARLNLLD